MQTTETLVIPYPGGGGLQWVQVASAEHTNVLVQFTSGFIFAVNDTVPGTFDGIAVSTPSGNASVEIRNALTNIWVAISSSQLVVTRGTAEIQSEGI